jgi:hypothetical protein
MRAGQMRMRVVPPVPEVPEGAGAVDFAESVRLVCSAARSNELAVPAFRSPPRISGVDRSLTRSPAGEAVVSIRLANRPLVAVQADLIDSVLHVNRTPPEVARRFRAAAWEAFTSRDGLPASQVMEEREQQVRVGSPRVA